MRQIMRHRPDLARGNSRPFTAIVFDKRKETRNEHKMLSTSFLTYTEHPLTGLGRFGHFEWFKSLSFRARTLKGLHYGGGCGAIWVVGIFGGGGAGNGG